MDESTYKCICLQDWRLAFSTRVFNTVRARARAYGTHASQYSSHGCYGSVERVVVPCGTVWAYMPYATLTIPRRNQHMARLLEKYNRPLTHNFFLFYYHFKNVLVYMYALVAQHMTKGIGRFKAWRAVGTACNGERYIVSSITLAVYNLTFFSNNNFVF